MSDCGSPCNPCEQVIGLSNCVRCIPGESDPNCVRVRLSFCAWENRQQMICGRTPRYLFSISPHGKQFLVTPLLNENTVLKVVWDGYKYDFAANDIINFPAEASEAVAAYVNWKIARTVDKNLALAKEYEIEYQKLRLALFRDFNEGQFPDFKDEEYVSVAPPIPVDTTVTTWDELGDLTSAGRVINSILFWVEAATGLLQVVQLRVGTDATDQPNGVQRPDDYNAATNARVWYKVN